MPDYEEEVDNMFEDFLCEVEMQKVLIDNPDRFEMICAALAQHKSGAPELVVATALNELLED